MASNWQLWLSPRPRFTTTVHETELVGPDNAMRYKFIEEHDGRRVVQETHYIRNKAVRDGLSGPPLHIHLRQIEYFQVLQGTLGVVKNGKEYTAVKEDGPVSIPAGVRHTFWAHNSSTEDLVFKVWVDPQEVDYGFDEDFMRNFNSYIKDCEKEKLAPSIFQILLFLYHSDIVLTPPFWLPIWFLVALHHVFAYWIGAGILGYKPTYPQYSANSTARGTEKVSSKEL